MKRFLVCIGLFGLIAGCAAPTAVPPTTAPTEPPPTVLLVTATPLPVPPTPVPQPPEPTALPPTTAPTTAPAVNLGETKTYHDTTADFELDYPADWNITLVGDDAKKNSVLYSSTIYSFPPRVSGEGIPEGESKMDILVNKNGAKSMAEAVELRKQEFASSDLEQKVLTEESWTLANGLQATRLLVSDRFGESSEVITALNGSTILLGGVGDYAILDAISQTLRPATSSSRTTAFLPIE